MLLKSPRRSRSFLLSCLAFGIAVLMLIASYATLEPRHFQRPVAAAEAALISWRSASVGSGGDIRGVLDDAAALTAIRRGSLRCGQLQAMFPGRIPPIVHWTNRDDRVLHQHRHLVATWQAVLGNSAAYMLWDDSRIEQLLHRHYPALWQRYRHLGAGIMRSDIGRLAIVDHVGGVYTDMDAHLLRSFLPLLRNHTSLWSQEPIEHAYYLYDRPRFLSNALFMSQARHPFLSHVLATWPAWFDANWSRRSSGHLRNSGFAVAMTGPLMLNQFLDEYEISGQPGQPSLAPPEAFQPLWDAKTMRGAVLRSCAFTAIMTTDKREWCGFLRATKFKTRPISPASYAVHLYMHTGYGGQVNYTGAATFDSLVNASSCVI